MCKWNISEQLLRLRTEKGVTQEDVAQALSVSNKTVSKWETGAAAPDLAMLVALAKYYDVSADALLGLGKQKKQDTQSMIDSMFEGLDWQDVIRKAFEIAGAAIPVEFHTFSALRDAQAWRNIDESDLCVFPEKKQRPYSRSAVTTNALYHFIAEADDVNLAVMLLRNRENFRWLRQEESLAQIALLLSFLGDTDALKICGFIHSTACSLSFTADYIAKHTGVEEKKAAELLERSCEIGLCMRRTAHFVSGDSVIYKSYGDGNILTLITLAYEHMCGENAYYYRLGGNCKMIGGETSGTVTEH